MQTNQYGGKRQISFSLGRPGDWGRGVILWFLINIYSVFILIPYTELLKSCNYRNEGHKGVFCCSQQVPANPTLEFMLIR